MKKTESVPTASLAHAAAAAPVSAGEVRVLSVKEQAEGDKRYWERIEYFDKQEVASNRHALMNSWELGQMVEDLVKNNKKYGGKTVETFALDLKKLELKAQGRSEEAIKAAKVNADVLRIHHRYFQRYPEREAVEEHVKQRIPWGVMHLLISVGDSRKREGILQKYLTYRDHEDKEKAITRDKLEKMVHSVNKTAREEAKETGAKVETRGGANLTSAVRTTTLMGDDFSQKLEEFKAAIKEFSLQTEDKRDPKLVLRVKEAHKLLIALRTKLEEALKLFG